MSLFVNDKLWICAVFLIGGHHNEIHVGSNSKTPVSTKFTFQLIPQIGGSVSQKLYAFSVRKSIFQIDVSAHERIEFFDLWQSFDVQSVYLIHTAQN